MPIRSRLIAAAVLGALLPLACGTPSCREGCVQSDEWVDLRQPVDLGSTLTFTVAIMAIVVDEKAFRDVLDASPALRPKGRARIYELLSREESIAVGPGAFGAERHCFWILTRFIERGEASVWVDGHRLSRLRIRELLYGNPKEWSASGLREYWTENGVRLIEFVTWIQ